MIDRIVEFYRLIPDAQFPRRAERSAAGYLPSRGMRYCDALTSATGFGYWIFPPMDFRLMWDGEQIFWSFGEDESWMPLSGTDSGAVQYPGFAEIFDRLAPQEFRGYSPPFLTALPEQGGVQMWTGLLARTRSGWSLANRAPVNLPGPSGVVVWEGIVETDIWFGPLFTNFRLTKTDTTVHVRSSWPFLQVQPIPQIAYREEYLAAFSCHEVTDLASSAWNDLSKILLPHANESERQGEYAVAVRKRRLCPVDYEPLRCPSEQIAPER